MTAERPGDLVLYPVTAHSAVSSKLVALGEWMFGVGQGVESYSHAAILDINGYEYEAKWPVAGRYRIDTDRAYEVWRVEGLSEAQRRHVLQWCEQRAGEWYDLAALVTFGFLRSRHRAVCSQFVARAYAHAGFHFSAEHQRLVSPNALVDHPKAVMVRRYLP